MTVSDPLSTVEATMLCISEARERAESAARELRAHGNAALADALADAERRLMDLHGEIVHAAYFPSTGREQLKLAG